MMIDNITGAKRHVRIVNSLSTIEMEDKCNEMLKDGYELHTMKFLGGACSAIFILKEGEPK